LDLGGGGTGGKLRSLQNEELHNLYASQSFIRVIKSRRMRWARHIESLDEMKSSHSILVGKPEGKRPLGRSRRRWEENVRMDLWERG
jgi:hypothetical protein